MAGGCSNSPYDMAPVTGRVTIDGQAFGHGKVMFAPVATGKDRNSGRAAFGVLESDGSFALSTYEPGDGAVVGEHWVTVIHIPPDGGPPKTAPLQSTRQFSRVAMPRKVVVQAGQENRIDVNLTPQEVAQYGVFDE
jgi:hypothetical protein